MVHIIWYLYEFSAYLFTLGLDRPWNNLSGKIFLPYDDTADANIKIFILKFCSFFSVSQMVYFIFWRAAPDKEISWFGLSDLTWCFHVRWMVMLKPTQTQSAGGVPF